MNQEKQHSHVKKLSPTFICIACNTKLKKSTMTKTYIKKGYNFIRCGCGFIRCCVVIGRTHTSVHWRGVDHVEYTSVKEK